MKTSHTITILEDGVDGAGILLKLDEYNTYSGELIMISPEAVEKLKKGMHPKDLFEREWFSIPIEPSESQWD